MTDSPDDFREPVACPACGERDLSIEHGEDGWFIVCDNEECGHGWGPFKTKPKLVKEVR